MNPDDESDHSADLLDQPQENGYSARVKVKRTPKDIYKVPDEESALLGDNNGPKALELSEEEAAESGSPIVTVAIYINLAANAVLLIGKIVGITLRCVRCACEQPAYPLLCVVETGYRVCQKILLHAYVPCLDRLTQMFSRSS